MSSSSAQTVVQPGNESRKTVGDSRPRGGLPWLFPREYDSLHVKIYLDPDRYRQPVSRVQRVGLVLFAVLLVGGIATDFFTRWPF